MNRTVGRGHAKHVAARAIGAASPRRRGVAMVEYILICALVAIGLIGAFHYWGNTLFDHLTHIAWDSSAALEVIIKR